MRGGFGGSTFWDMAAPDESQREVTEPPDRIETIVIGGGQSGLAVGHHLTRRGRPLVILDMNERIGDPWRKRWDSLRVFTPARLSGLPGMPFPAPASSFPTKDEVADYMEAYASRFKLPVLTSVTVDGLSRSGDRFVVASGDRRFEADNVVVATGAYSKPRIPAFASELDPAIMQLHSSEYRRPSQLREGGALVVGAGNSGAEIALEASRSHQTWLSGRDTGHEPVRAGSGPDKFVTPLMWFAAMHVLTVRTAIGRKVQRMFRSQGIPLARIRRKDLTEAGVELVPRTAGVRDGRPVLEDGQILDVANVIWCTGFAPDFRWIDLPVFNDDGDVVHDRGIVESQPGLYFIGMYFQYALSSVLIGGVGRDAEHVARHIASRQPSRTVAASQDARRH
jgi:putative flavoprotein involved in K+ transport